MSNPQRHIGRMARTDQRLIVIFMQIPDREDHALVVASDSLPPRFEQALMQVVQSPEGQNAQDLGTVLARRLMPDTNASLLNTLHTAGLLQPIPVDNIVMFPLPNQAYPLRKILESMGRLIQPVQQQFQNPYGDPVSGATPYGIDLPEIDPNDPQFLSEAADPWGDPYAAAAQQAQAAPLADPNLYAAPDRFNQHLQNQNAGVNERNVGIANNLLIEAQMLESEAARKREQAYQQAPNLRPAPVQQQQPAPARRPSQTPMAPVPVAAPAPTAKKPRAPKAPVAATRAAPKRAKASK